MYPELLKNFEAKDIYLDNEEAAYVCSFFRHRKFRKNQYILQQGDVARYESFIISGLTRTYLVDDKGQEHVISFDKEDHWVGDLYSFYTSGVTMQNIDCLEPTEVLQISRPEIEKLLVDIPKMTTFYMRLFRNSIISYHQRVGSSLSKSAQERYLEFGERFPHIEQRVPNHQIASYLGITPQSLSRLRKRGIEQKD